MPDDELLQRALAFQLGISERESTRTEPFRWGTAYFNDDVPASYDHNFLDVEMAVPGVAPEEILAEADRMQGDVGLTHREMRLLSYEDGERMAPAFRGPGWRVERNLYMAMLAEPEDAPDTSAVRAATWEQTRPAVEITTRRAPYATSDAVARQLIDRALITMGAIDTRFLVSEIDGQVASYCHLYSDGSAAQVEDVNTLDEYRGRGLAQATVWAAVELARSEDHDFIWLIADEDDWPQHLYRKLGFRDIGRTIWFVRAGTHE
ncbi:MAG: GNAT family N-acetyltransferase [Actinomycetota bacterium]